VELEQKKNIIIIAITSFFVLSRSITRMIHDIGKCLLWRETDHFNTWTHPK